MASPSEKRTNPIMHTVQLEPAPQTASPSPVTKIPDPSA